MGKRAKSTSEEREQMLRFTLDVVEQQPTITPLEFYEAYCKNPTSAQKKSGVYQMSFHNAAHYVSVAKMLFKTINHTEKEKITVLSEEDYGRLIATGNLLSCISDNLNRTAVEELPHILKVIVDHLPGWHRKDIINFAGRELIRLNPTQYPHCQHHKHHTIRDNVAKPYLLRELGCKFATTEAHLEKPYNNMKGLILDVYGWKDDGTICGIEVKTSAADYRNTQKVSRLIRYAKYCNELYILVTNKKSFQDLIEWTRECTHEEIGILLYDKTTSTITECVAPRASRKEVTDAMLNKMHEIFISKGIKAFNSIYLDLEDTHPDSAFKKMSAELSQSYIAF